MFVQLKFFSFLEIKIFRFTFTDSQKCIPTCVQWIWPPHIFTYTQFFYLICFNFEACRPIELSAHLIEYIEKVSEASFIWNKGNILQI